MRPARGADGTGATREGCALLQGLAICGVCGRQLGVFYRGPRTSIPGYQCNGGVLVGGGQGRFCTRASGLRIDPAVAAHVLDALTPLALQAASTQPRTWKPATTPRWISGAARPSRPATPRPGPNAATARSTRKTGWSPAAWKPNGNTPCAVRLTPTPNWTAAKPPARPAHRSRERSILALGADLHALWAAPSTTDRDRKELLHALLDDVVITVDEPAAPPASCCTGKAG